MPPATNGRSGCRWRIAVPPRREAKRGASLAHAFEQLCEALLGQAAVIPLRIHLRGPAEIGGSGGGVFERQHRHAGAPVESSDLWCKLRVQDTKSLAPLK